MKRAMIHKEPRKEAETEHSSLVTVRYSLHFSISKHLCTSQVNPQGPAGNPWILTTLTSHPGGYDDGVQTQGQF